MFEIGKDAEEFGDEVFAFVVGVGCVGVEGGVGFAVFFDGVFGIGGVGGYGPVVGFDGG